jgi:hypothetical protein
MKVYSWFVALHNFIYVTLRVTNEVGKETFSKCLMYDTSAPLNTTTLEPAEINSSVPEITGEYQATHSQINIRKVQVPDILHAGGDLVSPRIFSA